MILEITHFNIKTAFTEIFQKAKLMDFNLKISLD
jgi:hypothetical protein